MGFSIPHLLMVLAIIILVFGTRRLKTVGSDLGEAIKGFRNAVKEGEENQPLSRRDDQISDVEIADRQQYKA